jgi:hypothetical protein
MADYHPLIARAVTGLEKNTGENRRALYERARTALVAQLRGVQPALDESEITRERLALEEAIRKVEAESARQAREQARPTFVKRADLPRREDKRDEAPRSPPPASPRPATPSTPPRPQPNESAAPRSSGGRRTLQDEALRGFRDTASNPNAAAEARRSERYNQSSSEQGLPPAPSLPPPGEPNSHGEYSQLEPQMQPENLWALPLDGTHADAPTDFDAAHPPPPAQPHVQEMPEEAPPPRRRQPRSYGKLIRTGLIVLLIAGVAGLAFWQRENIAGLAGGVAALFKPSAAPPQREAAPSRPKITDRIGQPSPTPSNGLPVAQRVVLYEEDPDDPQGKRYVGTVLWRTELKPAVPGRPPELAVRGDIEVPERKMTVTWSLRRNTDQSLPASHTIEIVFNLPADSPTGGVQNVPGVLMKQAEQTRGVPLSGLAVKVTPGYFLIGLSALETDMQRNIQLLKDRSWFDIPIVYNNNRRAILALEKGTPGEKAFTDAFTAWKQ